MSREQNTVRLGELYPVAPEQSLARREDYRLVWTGEVREPVAGEWYLSGAIVEGYRARRQLSHRCHIARLIRGETVTVWRPLTEDEQ